MSTPFWILAIVLGASLVLQGFVLRIKHRRRAARLQARQLQFEQTMNTKVEQAKRQIGQLQADLAAARLQLKQAGKSHAQPTRGAAAGREALEREFDEMATSRHSLPPNGFADTRPLPQVTEFGSLLFQ